MAGLGDIFGANGMLEQLLLWNVVGQVVEAMGQPAFTALTQDVMAKAPDIVLSPDVLATAVSRHLIERAEADKDAAKGGINADRFATLVRLAKVRLSPADLAEAVLRSYMSAEEAQREARPQGIDAAQLRVLSDLAGDAPGPDQLTAALRRGIIEAAGKGADSVSYEQGIAETRLHNKWGPVLKRLSEQVLSPADAADAVVRGFLKRDAGEHLAHESGVNAETFRTMVHLAGDAPGPEQLAEALRRGAITRDSGGPEGTSFVAGIAQGRLADKWAPVIEALAKLWPSPTDALDARLKGQVSAEEGKDLYQQLGGDMRFYQWLLDSRGNAPTPLEAIQMANRGIIPWRGKGPDKVSYQQAFLEGPWRNKWEGPYRELGKYVPSEGTVITLVSHGALTPEQGAKELAKQGMDAPIIEAFLDEAHTEALSDFRGLTIGDTLSAYMERIISATDAHTILTALHVTPQAADVLIAYTDLRRGYAAVNSAVSRVRSLFAARKITVQTAQDALTALDVPATQAQEMLQAWEIENSISVKTLSEAQIIDAWEVKALTQDEASAELVNIGYTPFDAWLLMSVKAKQPLPNKPARGPAPPQAQVVPGTT